MDSQSQSWTIVRHGLLVSWGLLATIIVMMKFTSQAMFVSLVSPKLKTRNCWVVRSRLHKWKKKFYPNPRGFSSLQVQSWDKVSITFPYRCVKSVCRSEKYLLDCSSNSPFLLIRQARNNRKDMTTQEADKSGRDALARSVLLYRNSSSFLIKYLL